MAYSDITPAFAVDEVVTDARLDQLRLNIEALGYPPAVHVASSTGETLSIPNNTWTRVTDPFLSVQFDTDGEWDAANARINFDRLGKRTMGAVVTFASNSTGLRKLRLGWFNGTTTIYFSTHVVPAITGDVTTLVVSYPFVITGAGQYGFLEVMQTSGGSLDLEHTTSFHGEWRGF